MINKVDFTPHILSDEEIEMYLKGDRRDIDRLLLYSINRIVAVLIPHADKEDARELEFDRAIAELGGAKTIFERAKFVDALIKKTNEEAAMYKEAARRIKLYVISGFILAVAVVLVYFWNGHTPSSMHLPFPTGGPK